MAMAKAMALRSWIGLGVAALVLGGSPALAADDAGVTAQAAFARLKGLVGEWPAQVQGHFGGDAKMLYKVTGGGQVLMETHFPGTEHEMISMYHIDGDDLRMTHYCAAGNQPRLKLDRRASTADKLVFAFDGGTNLDPAKDMHIHAATITFKDGGKEIVSAWDAYQGEKKLHTETFVIKK